MKSTQLTGFRRVTVTIEWRIEEAWVFPFIDGPILDLDRPISGLVEPSLDRHGPSWVMGGLI